MAEASEQAEQVIAEAQEKATRLERAARTDADRITNEAHGNAARMDAEAKTRLAQINKEADDRRAEVVAKLEADRDELAHTIDELQQFEREYRARLKLYFTEQLQALEASDDGTAAGNPRVGASAQAAERRRLTGITRSPAGRPWPRTSPRLRRSDRARRSCPS